MLMKIGGLTEKTESLLSANKVCSFQTPSKYHLDRLPSKPGIIQYIYNSSRKIKRFGTFDSKFDNLYSAFSYKKDSRDKGSCLSKKDLVARNFTRLYKCMGNVKKRNIEAIENIIKHSTLKDKDIPINLGVQSKKLIIEQLKPSTTIRYANKDTYQILSFILKRQNIFGLKRMEQDYEKSNINSDLKAVSNYKKLNSSSKIKLDFMNDSERRRKSSIGSKHTHGFANKTISDFPLSVLRSNYRARELSRIKSLRKENIKSVYDNFLYRFGMTNNFTAPDEEMNTRTMDEVIGKKLHRNKDSLKSRLKHDVFKNSRTYPKIIWRYKHKSQLRPVNH